VRLVVLPEFNDDGYLPPGVHVATLDEVAARFGQESELRHVQLESLRWLIDLARRAGVVRLVVNGTFVTDALEPNDVDCVLLVDENFPRAAEAEIELRQGLPFVDIHIVGAEDFDLFVTMSLAPIASESAKVSWRSCCEPGEPARC
jgi:hypothetical protein